MSTQQETFTLVGVIDRITFKSAETGFAVLRMKVSLDQAAHSFVDGKGIVTLVGPNLLPFNVGEKLQVVGTPTQHSQFGWRLEVSTVTMQEPSSSYEIQRYLAKNVKHVDAHFARKIVERFGEQTLQIIDANPDRLREIPGFGEKRLEALKIAWVEKRTDRELIVFFTSIGLPVRFVDAIKKKYAARRETIIETIRFDPYVLARDIDGIGFATADEVAKKLGLPEISQFRIKAAIFHVLRERQLGRGDCFQYAQELVAETLLFLKHPAINQTMVVEQLHAGVASKELIINDNRVYLASMDATEVSVVTMLKALMEHALPASLCGQHSSQVLEASLGGASVNLDPTQIQAVQSSLRSKVSLIVGGPGTGKSTITKCLVAGYRRAGLEIHLLAPTGRAAKRMSEIIKMPASTIHRALGYGSESYGNPEPLSGVIIVDEFSMADVSLFQKLLSAITPESVLLLIGDHDQLPSVGPGAVLRDLMQCGGVHKTVLTQIHRQAAGSDIIVNAHGVNNGYLPRPNILSRNTMVANDFYNHNFYTCYREDPQQQADAVVWLATFAVRRMGYNPFSDLHVMSPQHGGPNGVQALNARLQAVLNPNAPDCLVRGHESQWRVGDKMMVHKNTYPLDLFNGDTGILKEIVREGESVKGVVVNFDGRDVTVPSDMFKILHLSYASTIHRSQGSEYPVVIMVLHTCHYTMLQRNLLYTSLTRGRQWVFLVAHPSALGMCLANQSASKRNTFLAERFNGVLSNAGR